MKNEIRNMNTIPPPKPRTASRAGPLCSVWKPPWLSEHKNTNKK